MDTPMLGLYDRVVGEVESLRRSVRCRSTPVRRMRTPWSSARRRRCPAGPKDHTLYHTVTQEIGARSGEGVAAYLYLYPFRAEGRNDLFQEYVDRILAFCARHEVGIGVTDLGKQPLTACW